MKATSLHGFNVRDNGAATVGQVEPMLRDYGFEIDSDEADYGYFGLLDIRMRNGENRRKMLYRIAKALENTDLLLTHSNGGHFGDLSLKMLPAGTQTRIVVVNVSAAMNRKTEPSEATKAELNLCTKHDGWVKAASYLPFKHPWGRRGARGYSGEDRRVYNQFHDEVDNHSDWFLPQHVDMTFEAIIKFWERHK